MRRVPQPPVNPALRPVERHGFWPPFLAIAAAAVLVFLGARHLTAIETVQGDTAWEYQLVKAFASGGLKFPDASPPPPPAPKPDDPAGDAEAMQRWARQANAGPPTWKVRIDTESKAACPT